MCIYALMLTKMHDILQSKERFYQYGHSMVVETTIKQAEIAAVSSL